jgi:desulfoferrodoxin-like iron-binding protein
MSKLDIILSRVTEEYAQGMRMRCDVCGKIAEIQDEGRGPLMCCNKPMVVMGTYTPQMPQLESGFKKYPKGWSGDSVKKFGRTLSKNMKGGVKSKGFFEKCVKKMRGKMENPEGFCASVKDENYESTYWRGKDKPAAEVRKDTKQHKMAKFKEGVNHAVEKLLEYEEAYFITQCDKENDRIEDKLLCLKKAYILCGANRVCQQRIDRFYDALTGNFEGSGEAPLQTVPQTPGDNNEY